MKVIQSGRQTARRLIIFRRMCTSAILFWAYLYAVPSNVGHFGQTFWHIIHPLTEALLTSKAELGIWGINLAVSGTEASALCFIKCCHFY